MNASNSTSTFLPGLALVSSHELVQKDHQRELDRVVQSSEVLPLADYTTYVLLPLLLLLCAIVALRKLLAL